MSNQQPNVWQTANRARQPNSASRTPQNRSSNASPAPPSTSTQSPRQNQTANSVWTQRGNTNNNSNITSSNGNASTSVTSNGQPKGSSPAEDNQQHTPLNGFNAEEVKTFLSRVPAGTVYKVPEVSGAGKGAGGAAWGVKGHTASNQPFFGQLAKQIATLEGGG